MADSMPLRHDLTTLGLTEKEARVYLAGLELGASGVQEIAARARVKRPTAYLAIEALTHEGLMSSVESEGRRMFISEPPERLRSLCEERAKLVRNQTQVLDTILPELLALASGAEERPRVRFYEGLDGLETMREAFLKTNDKQMVVFSNLDDYRRVVPARLYHTHEEQIQQLGISGREIYTASAEPVQFISEAAASWQTRRVLAKTFPFAGEIAALGNQVALLSYGVRPVGVLVENKDIAQMVRAIFDLAWAGAAGQSGSRNPA